MGQQVTINSVTANTPVEIYYCDSMSANCVYVATVSVFPYTFEVGSPYDTENIIIKIIDTQSCVEGHTIYITPTATPVSTVTPTQTSSSTPTNTPTQTITPTNTTTSTSTPTNTPTNTPTPTTTPVIAYHLVGSQLSVSSASTCNDIMTIKYFYTYISQANSVPVLGAILYETLVNGTLFNPFNGNNNYMKLQFGGSFYIIQIDVTGAIIDFAICP